MARDDETGDTKYGVTVLYRTVQEGRGREREQKRRTQVEAVAIASSIPREIGQGCDPENAHGLNNATVTVDHHIFTFVGRASARLGVFVPCT